MMLPLWIFVTTISYCLAIPTFSRHKLVKKEVASASESGSNLLDVSTDGPNFSLVLKNISTAIQANVDEKKSDSKEKQNITNSGQITSVQSRIFEQQLPKQETNNRFKVKILDLTNPTGQYQAKQHQISIGSPIYHQQPHIIKVPEVYVVKVPHYVVVKESDLFNTHQHFIPTTLTGHFQPFQEIPSLTQDFPSSSGDNLFGTSSVYPIHSIEIPQLSNQPIISGINEIPLGIGLYPSIIEGSEIPVISDINGLPEGLEILNLDHLATLGLTDAKIDHDKESITVEALENLNKVSKGNKNTKIQKEKHDENLQTKINIRQHIGNI